MTDTMMTRAPEASTLADVTAVLRYAQSVMPLTEPPSYTGLTVDFCVHLHRVPTDVFDAMLAVNDDLQWDVRRWPATSDPQTEYRSASLRLTHTTLHVYSVHTPVEAA